MFQIQLIANTPMKSGASLRAESLFPVYVDGKLVLPAHSPVMGKVTGLMPNRKERLHARFYGDFTPYRSPQVSFDSLLLAGDNFRLHATVSGGTPVIRLTRPASSRHRSFIRRQWDVGIGIVTGTYHFFIDRGRSDRMLQVFYHQLPYHPQRINKGTAWTLELTQPLTVPFSSVDASNAAVRSHLVEAVLTEDLNSATSHEGDSVTATVVEPFHDANDHIDIPQGATLVGKVTEAEPARSRARNGKLRFTFQQIHMPAASTRNVEGNLAGATAGASQNLELDAEGGITPRNTSSIVMPLALTILAQRAMDYDDPDVALQSGVASNGFGLMGRIAGVASGERNVAAGIGFYAVALSVWENYLRHGRDADFPKGTRIEVDVTPVHAPVIKPQGER
ncbi:MAG TPA: hypothetical protein VG844_12710 [Terracidiphilus sp.]|nr:hypothetical protein [Terracidiphilus sp.]